LKALVLVACSLMSFSAVLMGVNAAGESPLAALAQGDAAGLCDGEPCDAVDRGLRAFFDRRLDGLSANGRSCADCHMETDSFQLSPASAEARFQALQTRRQTDRFADDPLFREIDADDFRLKGEGATDFSNLRQNGLVRIAFALPPNIRLVDPVTNAPSTETFADVWRSVPTVNDVVLTGPDGVNPWTRGPNASGGYQLDARVTTLQEQALGALTNHAEIQNAPPQQLLDDLASVQRVLFTNHRVRALAKAVREGRTPLPDTDPPLNALEQQGKAVFVRACTQCHGGPGQSTTPAPGARFHNIGSQCPRPVDTVTPARFVFDPCPPRLARNERTYEITLSDGSRIRRTSSDPGRALVTGFVDGPLALNDWDKFDMPTLRGLARTAPYFHNNSAATLEAVVDHYDAFFKRFRLNTAAAPVVPPGLSTDGVNVDRPHTPEERAALLAYLRKL
jgi:cytochrome c peroxidase